MQKTSSIDCLSSSTLWSSRHLLKPLTRPAQSDMPQLRLCQCWMSMLTRRRFPVARIRNMWLSLGGDVEVFFFSLLQSSSLEALLWRLEVAGRFLCLLCRSSQGPNASCERVVRKQLLLCSSLLQSCLRKFHSLTACCCFDCIL